MVPKVPQRSPRPDDNFDKTVDRVDAGAMVSLIVHGLLGVLVVWLVIRSNPAIFRRPASDPLLSTMKIALYAGGVVSIGIGWCFNVRYVTDNTDGWFTNPFVGDGSWE